MNRTIIDIQDSVLRGLGACLIKRHGNGIGDIDVVVNTQGKAAWRRKADKLFIAVGRQYGYGQQEMLATLHIHSPLNAPENLF